MKNKAYKTINGYVVVNIFFISGIFSFSFFSTSLAYSYTCTVVPYPKTKEKQKITWDKKLTTTDTLKWLHKHINKPF